MRKNIHPNIPKDSARNSVCYSDWVRRIIRRIAKFVRSVSYSVKFDWPKKNRIRIRRTRGSDVSKCQYMGVSSGLSPLLAGIRIRIRRAGLIRIPFGFGFGEWPRVYSDSDFYSANRFIRISGAAIFAYRSPRKKMDLLKLGFGLVSGVGCP